FDRVAEFLDRQDFDVLAIQETKCRDDQFPFELFDELGYEVAHLGINQWNGVAPGRHPRVKTRRRNPYAYLVATAPSWTSWACLPEPQPTCASARIRSTMCG
uniref:endonuclease/exonuclease/phosphatase family protein n=1 Tax=Nocardia brasiliensis TaxID=37326 RepID=UPI00313C09E6